MGCCQSGKSYFDINNADEKDIRRFEKEIGGFAIDFNVVNQKISSDTETLKADAIKRIVKDLFSEEFKKVVSDSFFVKADNQTQLDASKIISLIYLVTSQGIVSSQYASYPDKAYYFYIKSKSAEEEDLSRGLSKDSNLLSTLKDLTEVALAFSKIYFTVKKVDERGIVSEALNKLDDIAEFVAKDLFTIKGKEVDVLSFSELKEKFSSDPYFFSGGYFREKSVEYLQLKLKKEDKQ